MATYDTVLSNSDYILRLIVNQSSQNIANNTSTVSWSLTIIKGSGSGKWSFYTKYWSVNIGGQTASGSFGGYDFRNYTSLALGSGSFVIAHNADGTKTIANSGSFSEANINVGNGTASGNLALTTIPRASTASMTPSTLDAGTSMTINTNRASTSFTHTVRWAFGTQSGTIATGVATSTTWTPPLSLLNEIPNAASGVGSIILDTYSGATLIGTKSTNFTLTAPASVVPDFTTITVAEAVAAVTTVMGSGVYVQNQSKLSLAITGAVGAYGSTISTFKIETPTQTINAQSGTTPSPIATSGAAVVITGTVTDSRGRTRTKTVTINVLAWAPPVLNAPVTFRRALSNGTLADEGTYIRIDLNATVSSLINSTQRNTLTYKVYSRTRGNSVWNIINTTTPAGLTFNSYILISPYAISTAYEVRVEVIDKFDTTAAEGTVATATIFMHWGDGLGLGKYYEAGRGTVDAIGQMYQNDGEAVASRIEVTAVTSRTGTITGITTTGFEVLTAGGTVVAKTGDRYFRPKLNDAVVVAPDGDGNWILSPSATRGYISDNLTLANGWTSYQRYSIGWSGTGPWNQPKVFKTASGVVSLSGLIQKSSATSDGEIITTLPPEFRPEYNDIYAAYTNGNTFARVHVGTDGVVRLYSANIGYVSLNNVKFLTGGSWTNAALLNSFTAYTTALVAGQTLVTPGYAQDIDGITWVRGNVARVGTPADNTAIFNLPVGMGPRVGYQHHHPINSSAASGFAALGLGSAGATSRSVGFKTVGTPNMGRIGMGGAAFVSESFTGIDYDFGANIYNSQAGWTPRYGVTPDGLVLASGLTTAVASGSLMAYYPPEYRPALKMILAAVTSTGVFRNDLYNGDGSLVSSATATTWISVESAFMADQIPMISY